MLNRLAIGCFGLLMFACVAIGGWAFYENWQQEQNFNAGEQAYLKADCAAALEPLRKAARGEPGTRDSDVARKAQARLQECEALVAATDLAKQNKPADAVIRYSDFITKYVNSPLKATALSSSQTLVKNTKPNDLATDSVCQRLTPLAAQQIIATPAETMPPLLYACGQNYEAAKKFSEAVLFYGRLRREYPNHSLAKDAQTAFARATIAEAQAMGAGALPPPQARSGSAGTQVTVVIRNDSPEPLSIVFSGPDVRVEELEACATCVRFTGTGPSACPDKGPVGRYVLKPGSYDVVVKTSSGRNVTPFRGTWNLDRPQEYSSCFYLVTRN
jgi:hypothetical protein